MPRRASIVDMAVWKGSRHTYLHKDVLVRQGNAHGKGFAMVCTTLNFAEKYLLKPKSGPLPVCPAVLPMLVLISMSISVARATSEAIMPPVSIARYRPTIIGLQPDMPMSHCIDGRDDAVRARR